MIRCGAAAPWGSIEGMRCPRGLAALLLASAWGGSACGGGGATGPADAPAGSDAAAGDATIDASGDAGLPPQTLADTGLCVDAACTTIAPGVRAYAPQFQLYSDGATKRRWLMLPAGTTIDTTDMDHWRFPVGTKLWKEFTRGTVRVETRYMEKLLADDAAPGAWTYATFQWNLAGDATTLASPSAGVMNANGTDHDIPTRANCRRCHEGVPGRVLGFGAISLDHAAPTGELDLQDAIDAGLLSSPPTGSAPYFPLPGTSVDRAAFGYLHANCGGCHNPRSPIYSTTQVELRLDVDTLGTVAEVPARATTVNVNGSLGGLTGKVVDPGNADQSVMIIRMLSPTFPTKMPEIGTETVDPTGEAAVRAWINQPP